MDIPTTPAGRQFAAWFSAFNSADYSEIDKLHVPFEKVPFETSGILMFRYQTGGFDLIKIEESNNTKLVGLLKERESDQFARFVMEVEEVPPHLVATFGLHGIPRPAEHAIARMAQSDLVVALGTKLEADAAADKFAGAVMVAKDGIPIFSCAYGLADREKKIANKLGTRFRNGSMNKMFTATATLRLVQDGAVSLSDPVGKFIPDYPNKDVAKVTIEQLLTHTGGTGDIFGPEFAAHRLELRTHSDYVALFGARAPLFEPGSQFRYSNYGFELLGAIIEGASGQDYYAHVHDRVFVPAGMTSTGSLPEEVIAKEISVGYIRGGKSELQPNTETLPYRGMAAGGGYTTVEDLLHFANALMSHKLLGARHLQLMTTGKVAMGAEKYAFGFGDIDAALPWRHFGHSGGAPGMNGDLRIYPELGYVVAALANIDPPAATRISSFIGNRLPSN
ncbi:MAG: serine hydrolase domain-containing protein [Alphaproteobacteria bacterium]